MIKYDIKAYEEDDGRADWEMIESKNGYFVESEEAEKIIKRYQRDVKTLLLHFNLTPLLSLETKKELNL